MKHTKPRGARYLLWMDMEGVSQITDYREALPVFRQYWETGRAKFTADAAAAATGLLRSGASEVVVIDGHGLGWNNLIPEGLPRGARPMGHGDRLSDFDGMMLCGFHARHGTPDGFMAHTFVPRLEVCVDGNPVTECHCWALRAGIPVLGIAGDHALGGQLDGVLRNVPFLGVKDSTGPTATRPAQRTQAASNATMTEFTEAAARARDAWVMPRLSGTFSLQATLGDDLVDLAVGRGGWRRNGPGQLDLRAKDWQAEADPALNASMGAAVQPLLHALGELDLTDEHVPDSGSPQLAQARRYFQEWFGA